MNLRIRIKILLLSLVPITLSTFFTGFLSYQIASESLERNILGNSREILVQSANYLNEKMNSILIQVHFLLLNENFKRALDELYYNSEVNTAIQRSRIESMLSQIKSRESLIESIQIFTPRINIFNASSRGNHSLVFTSTDLYREFRKDGLIYWASGGRYPELESEDEIIPIVLGINIQERIHNDHTLVINLGYQKIRNELENIAEKMLGEVYIINKNFNIVVSTDRDNQLTRILDTTEKQQSLIREGLFSDTNSYIFCQGFKVNDWYIISLQKNRWLMKDIQSIRYLISTIILFVILSMSILAIIFSNIITNPLLRLHTMINYAIQGNFTHRFNARYSDEIGKLGDTFDNMSQEIQDLFQEVEDEKKLLVATEREKRKAEFEALQMQMNPHFLYNTLDSLYWKAKAEGQDELADISMDLSRVFRMGLNKGKDITTVGNEVDHVRSYLNIQKIIYKGKFDYSISADPDLLRLPVLKLILQPLAENSLVHGLEDKNSGGQIDLAVNKEADFLCLSVQDNGKGFENTYDQVFEDTEELAGYGLGNIADRLNLHYEKGVQMYIKSSPGEGSYVCIRIPLKGGIQND